ncbi:Formate dehydrogenase [Hibiscus syriacus]|uniref:Formate dehydrogenase n=1 Tax=Hibiscus syriacus TaxID=106335 RepID=A0A6A3AQ00_HIBSY|nr:Formate dehydrogenase [Hibiscus syriacus]
MAMKQVASSAIKAVTNFGSSSVLTRQLHASPGSKKIVGVFYKANEYLTKNPNFVGCVEGALGLRQWLESQGHQYIVTDDKDGPDCELDKHISDLHVLISTPFHPAYVTAERIKKAKNLQLLLTAGIGSYHVDLKAAAEAGDWNVAGIAYRAYDLEGKTVGTIGADPELEKQTGAKFEEDLDTMLPKCDIIVVNMPLTEKTRGMFDKDRIAKMKKGVLIVNNARGAIMDTQAVADACSSGHIAGYSGDLRYAAGVKDMLERYFKGEEFPAQNYIVKEGELAPQYR